MGWKIGDVAWYGMVNKFLKEIITENHGAEIWDKAEKAAGHDTRYFVGMHQYPDEITYDIVNATSKVSGVGVEDLLREIGNGWVAYTVNGKYGAYYDMSTDVFALLRNINSIHSVLGNSVPGLTTPVFSCEPIDNKSIKFHYKSDRPGLTYFVFGIIEGAAKHYGQEISITISQRKDEGAENDAFIVSSK
jgi:hypothetical protein